MLTDDEKILKPYPKEGEGYEPYYVRKERIYPNTEFSEDSMKDYMWQRWGIK